MNKDTLHNIFSSKYNSTNWKQFLITIFQSIENAFFENPVDLKDSELTKHKGVKHIWEFGDITIADDKVIKLYEVELLPGHEVTKNRVGLRNIIHSDLIPGYIDGIIVTFHNPAASDWRFTFISKTLYWNDKNEEVKEETAPKRFTYLLGEGQTVRTAVNQFSELIEKIQSQTPTLQDILDTFSVEKISKEFYNGYIKQYEVFEKYLRTTTETFQIFESLVKNSATAKDKQTKAEYLIRNFVKKFLGRIVFLYFLQKKGWMGVPKNGDWGDGPRNFISKFFNEWQYKKDFYKEALVPLFFDTLNRDRSSNNDLFSITNTRIPYLNGGLFESSNDEPIDIVIEPKLIEALLSFFNQFNFTVDENQPNDQDIGVDPEMLSNIFENLLEDNKDTGAFYTPKEIVHYMTEESLLEYLITTCSEIEETALKNLVKNKEIGDLDDDEQRDIDIALDKVKICDPAIGSGAFPMGLLIEIFAIKSILAFEHGWKASSPATIKQKIIENSIYGVDIEPGAVDIARLRFWLSLIVEEDTPHALPNLDYKIVCGDSLLSRYKLNASITKVLEQYNKGRSKEDKLNVKGYKALMHKYLNASDKTQKEQYRQTIEEIKDAFKSEFEKKDKEKIRDARGTLANFQAIDLYTGKTKGTNAQIAKAKKELSKLETERSEIEEAVKYKEAIEWRFQFPNLLNNKSGDFEGFDIVIGNPPYIQLQNNQGQLAKTYETEGYKTFVRSGDIYSLFYERGNQILKEGGVLSYITSNKWMRAKYGQSTRKYFLEDTTITKLIDFGDAQLFDNATTYTNILIFKKGKLKEQTPQVFDISNKYKKDDNLERCLKLNNIYAEDLNTDGFHILEAKKHAIKKQIEKIGTPLSELDINIYRGILTGYNEAFIIDSLTKESLIQKDPKSAEIIKPIYRGRDIKKYKADFADLWLINSHNGIKTEGIPPVNVETNHPAVFAYLLDFDDRIKTRSDQGDHWSNLRNCAYIEDFEKDKIVWPETCLDNQFSILPAGAYQDKTSFFMPSSDLSLLAILNSNVVGFYLKQIVSMMRGGYFSLSKIYVERIPIIDTETTQKRLLSTLVDYILFLNSNIELVQNSKLISSYFEQVLNGIVYELYFEESLKINEKDIIQFLDNIIEFKNNDSVETKANIITNQFNIFYNSEHPVRKRLYYIDSVKEVRIIEGKDNH